MSKSITGAQAAREIMDWYKEEVCSVLRITAAEYATMQWECGQRYLRLLMPNDVSAIEKLETEKKYNFWNWFRNKWSERDYSFIQSDPYRWPLASMLDEYRELNNPGILACTISPGRVILEPVFKSVKMYAL